VHFGKRRLKKILVYFLFFLASKKELDFMSLYTFNLDKNVYKEGKNQPRLF
jgi:hypothetical protein